MEHLERELIVTASIWAVDDTTELSGILNQLVVAGFNDEAVLGEFTREARPSPVIDGRPRMLHISAWIAHEGANDNGDAFLAHELEAAVSERKLFAPGYAGFVDFNHDLVPRGYWYSAEYLFDPAAGKHGILAHGAVWAWLFPDFADKMLAEAGREGGVKVSMMCLTNSIESVKQNGRTLTVLHNPVFTGASLLDTRPGDPHANAVLAEDPSDLSPEERKQLLLLAASHQEDNNMDLAEILAALPQLSDDVVSRITAAIQEQADTLGTRVAQYETTIAELTTTLAAAEGRVNTLEAIVAEKDVALDSLRTEHETVVARNAELEADLLVRREAEEAQVREAMLEARVAELPTVVRERVASRPETVRAQLRARWAAQTDDEWAVTKEELTLGIAAEPAPFRLPSLRTELSDKGGRIDLDAVINSLSN
jgi:hypothetical protein